MKHSSTPSHPRIVSMQDMSRPSFRKGSKAAPERLTGERTPRAEILGNLDCLHDILSSRIASDFQDVRNLRVSSHVILIGSCIS